MKTAVSVPDILFRRAEAAARRLGISRSELYTTAIRDFLARNNDQAITRQLNDLYAAHPSAIDEALASAQSRSVEKESW